LRRLAEERLCLQPAFCCGGGRGARVLARPWRAPAKGHASANKALGLDRPANHVVVVLVIKLVQ
jgi:hypothetical protein